MKKMSSALAGILLALPSYALAAPGPAGSRLVNARRLAVGRARAAIDPAQGGETGIGVNNPVVGKLTGEGGVEYFTALDVSNNTTTPHLVTFSFDGIDLASGAAFSIGGNIVNPGVITAADLTQAMDAYSNAHFDDFVGALRDVGLISAQEYSDGVLGSVLIVFLGTSASGEGSSQARLYRSGCGGTIGSSVRGQEITSNNPLQLVGTFRDTTAEAGVPLLYPNVFVNNVGVTASGLPPADSGAVTVQLTAYSASNPAGPPIAQTVLGPIGPGQTFSFSRVFDNLSIPKTQIDTILVFAVVIDGTSAIEALQAEVDPDTRDSSFAEMGRADFFTP